MTKLVAILVGCAAVLCCISYTQKASGLMQKDKTIAYKIEASQLRHVVLFKFKDSATAGDISTVEQAFSELPALIDEIKGYEWGINNSPEGLDKGFTHCFLVSFDSEADRSAYLPHPAHLALVEVLKPHLDDVLVMDYWN